MKTVIIYPHFLLFQLVIHNLIPNLQKLNNIELSVINLEDKIQKNAVKIKNRNHLVNFIQKDILMNLEISYK
jgi:hypothetical protein